MTTYHLAERGHDGRLTVYATTRLKPVAEQLLIALRAAGHTGMEIVPVGRARTFAERYEALAA